MLQGLKEGLKECLAHLQSLDLLREEAPPRAILLPQLWEGSEPKGAEALKEPCLFLPLPRDCPPSGPLRVTESDHSCQHFL